MNTLPIESYLRDFEVAAFADGETFDPVASFDVPHLDPSLVSDKMEEVYARGLTEGREQGQEEWANERAALEAAHEERWRVAEEQSAADVDRLAILFTTAIEDLRKLVTDAVSDILRPFLLESVAERSLHGLLDALDRILRDPATPIVEISGPEKLVAALAERVRAQSISVSCHAGDPVDVQLRVGRSSIELRLAEWVAALNSGETRGG